MLKSIITAFAVRALGALSAFFMNIVIARQLPIGEAGYFLLMFTIVSILAPVNQVGSSLASLRFIGALYTDKSSKSNWQQIQKIANSTRLIVLVASILTSLGLWFFAAHIAQDLWGKPAMEPILRNSSIIIVVTSMSMVVGHQLQAISRTASSIAILSIVAPLAVSLLCISLSIENALDAIRTLQIATTINLIVSILLWIRYTTYYSFRTVELRPLLKTCLPLWVISVAAVVTSLGSQFVAVIWVDAEDIAKFAVAQRTALLVSFILIAVNMVTAPKFASLYHNKKTDDFRHLALKTTKIMVMISIPVSVLLIVFSGHIMSLFGKEFRSGGHLLSILALGQLVNVATGSVAQILNMSGHEKAMRNVVLISCPTTIVLALVLTPIYGVVGAAIATAIGVSVQNLGAVIKVKSIFGFNILLFWRVD